MELRWQAPMGRYCLLLLILNRRKLKQSKLRENLNNYFCCAFCRHAFGFPMAAQLDALSAMVIFQISNAQQNDNRKIQCFWFISSFWSQISANAFCNQRKNPGTNSKPAWICSQDGYLWSWLQGDDNDDDKKDENEKKKIFWQARRTQEKPRPQFAIRPSGRWTREPSAAPMTTSTTSGETDGIHLKILL